MNQRAMQLCITRMQTHSHARACSRAHTRTTLTMKTGAGGRAFLRPMLTKVTQLRELLILRGCAERVEIVVDGGITTDGQVHLQHRAQL